MQCPHFHLLCVRASYVRDGNEGDAGGLEASWNGALTTSIMSYNDSVTPGLNIGMTKHTVVDTASL